MDFFLIKKLIGVFLMPINITLLLLLLGLTLYKYKPNLSFKCFLLATIFLWLSATPIVSNEIMAPIEDNYVSFKKSKRPIDYIVVLGCGHSTNDALPALSQLKICSLERITEAVRIYRMHPEATIITSGFSMHDETSNAEKTKQAAIELGIPAQKILTENFPQDTEEEAELIAPRVKGANVVLVTNADHMPRAVHYFQLNDVNPIAAPTGHWVKNINADKYWSDYVPKSHILTQTSIAWYETLGRIWQWLKS